MMRFRNACLEMFYCRSTTSSTVSLLNTRSELKCAHSPGETKARIRSITWIVVVLTSDIASARHHRLSEGSQPDAQEWEWCISPKDPKHHWGIVNTHTSSWHNVKYASNESTRSYYCLSRMCSARRASPRPSDPNAPNREQFRACISHFNYSGVLHISFCAFRVRP